MIQAQNLTGKLLGALLALVMAATGIGAVPAGGTGGLSLSPDGDQYIQNAAMTVRTTKYAYKFENAIRGIDVSKYQGNISWSRVAQDGVDFAFVRSSYGMTNDPYFLRNATHAHDNGIKVGAYHYATFTDREGAREEARYFVSLLKRVDITYPVVLDLESAAHRRISRANLTSLALEFMDIVSAEGYTVMLYSYNNFFRDHLDVSRLSAYDFWIANYLEQPTNYAHKVWQHASTGRVDGISGNVDMNVAYEDLSKGGKRRIRVDSQVSADIKYTLNERYNAGLPLDSLDMNAMNAAIAGGLQIEVNRLWGTDLDVNGLYTDELIDYLAAMEFDGSTHGNITWLLQAKMVYRGLYSNDPSGWYDDEMVAGIRSLQQANSLQADGLLTRQTLQALLQG